jgi:hypothetical protein
MNTILESMVNNERGTSAFYFSVFESVRIFVYHYSLIVLVLTIRDVPSRVKQIPLIVINSLMD